MIRISVPLLDKQDVELDGAEPPEFLELGGGAIYRVDTPVEYHLLAKRVSGGALVSGRISVGIAGECGRCLEEVKENVVHSDVHLFLPIADEQELDISEDVRTEMLVELPMNLLCRDECSGLCPGCGVNLNSSRCRCDSAPPDDSAWNALDQLKL